MKNKMNEIHKLRELRTALGMTQKQISRTLSCSPLTVLRWEMRRQVPRPVYLREIRNLVRRLEKRISANRSA
jgi:DNA-binding transcriptional regulator YiaG